MRRCPEARSCLRYIDRQRRLEIETDQGEGLKGHGSDRRLLADWDVDVLDAEARSPYRGVPGRRPAKILHNVVLSMPSGTSTQKLLAASRAFAREQFALKHRYAMVLHTDQDHPHVYLVIKAMSEDGRRLNIRKATLCEWRREFARQLRAEGVAANATERAVRGEIRKPLRDGIYHAARRSDSRHVQQQVERILKQLKNGGLEAESGKAKLVATREAVVRGWHAVADSLLVSGQGPIAEKVWKFIGSMPPPATDHERIAPCYSVSVAALGSADLSARAELPGLMPKRLEMMRAAGPSNSTCLGGYWAIFAEHSVLTFSGTNRTVGVIKCPDNRSKP